MTRAPLSGLARGRRAPCQCSAAFALGFGRCMGLRTVDTRCVRRDVTRARHCLGLVAPGRGPAVLDCCVFYQAFSRVAERQFAPMWSAGLLRACAAQGPAKRLTHDRGETLVATKRHVRCMAGVERLLRKPAMQRWVERVSLRLLASFGSKLGAVARSLDDELMGPVRQAI